MAAGKLESCVAEKHLRLHCCFVAVETSFNVVVARGKHRKRRRGIFDTTEVARHQRAWGFIALLRTGDLS